MSRNQQLKPLLYIVQPEYDNIAPKMQELVIIKPEKKQESLPVEPIEPEIAETKAEISLNPAVEAEPEPEVEAEQSKKEEVIHDEKQERKRKPRIPISQMTIPEKVEFFTNLPKNMPKSLCLIETTDSTYRGIIVSEEDGVVTIRSLHHPRPIDIQLEVIQAINVLGF
ncbi:CotO family spore coat protein [uncultured Metabacillus sp.]|uniref:CotO family spore coat protein n=1 Tax=uncultured Metabacillus sp. TaxID=2860135 RepID=UPI002607D1BD|nr:CotO family spore coat protein [uncultured Metabacillus sp.]